MNEEDIGPIYPIHTGSEWGISSILVNYCGEEQHQRLGWSADSGTVHHHTKLVLNPLHSASGARHVILSSIGDIYKCHWQLERPLSSPVTLLHSLLVFTLRHYIQKYRRKYRIYSIHSDEWIFRLDSIWKFDKLTTDENNLHNDVSLFFYLILQLISHKKTKNWNGHTQYTDKRRKLSWRNAKVSTPQQCV